MPPAPTARLALAVVFAAAAASADAATVLVVPFARGADVPEWTSTAIAELMTDLVVQQNRDASVSLKQLDAVLRRRDLGLGDVADPEVALPVARSLGATDLVIGDVRRLGPRFLVRARRFAVGGGELANEGSEFALADLPVAAAGLARKLLAIDAATMPITANARALEKGMRCAADLIRLPLGPRAPARARVPSPDETEQACRDALAEDPGLGLAHAGLAIVEHARGHGAEALKEARLAHERRFVAQGFLVESYLLRLAGDAAGARAVLQKALAARPGFLHALGYLGEDQLDEREAQAALGTFDTYLARSPGHPWALAMKGKALARLGRHEPATAASRDAVAKNPSDPELLVELASRLIDAGRDADAEAPLAEALQAWPVRPVALLRMGYVKLRQKKLAEAKEFLGRTLVEAWREDESRTRGLAHVDLALVAGLEGRADVAVAELEAARAEGSPKKLPCADAAFAGVREDPRFKAICGGGK